MGSRISVAMIVKDEADLLGDCLESVKDLAAEICIVDTGSQDNTLEIARRYGARTSAFIWCDDFGAARNESLRRCTGDWILVLDADERIAPEDIPRLRSLVRGPDSRSYRFVTRNYTNTTNVVDFHPCGPDDPHAQGFAGWFPSVKVRLFPARRGVRFEGKVHEVVIQSLRDNGLQVMDTDIPVHHYPLAKEIAQVRKKQEMYLRLGHEKVAADPTNPKVYVELGRQYAEVGSYAQAAGAYREALKLDPSNPGVLTDLGGVLHLLGRHDEAKQALQLAVHIDANYPEAWRNLGVALVELKQWSAAVECFQRAMRLAPSWTEGFRYLSVALQGDERLEEAAAAARKALDALPEDPESLRLYIHQMLRLERRGEARETLAGLIRSGVSDANMHNALAELFYYDNDGESAKFHFRQAGNLGLASGFNNLGVVLIQERRYPEALAAFEECLRIDPNHHGAQANLQKVRERVQ